MTPAERLAHYAAENAAIIYVLCLLVILLGGSLIYVLILYVLEIIKTKNFRKREAQIGRELALRAAEITKLRELVGDVEKLQKDIVRETKLRDKAFAKLTTQNKEVETLQARIGRRNVTITDLRSEVDTLRGIVDAAGGAR